MWRPWLVVASAILQMRSQRRCSDESGSLSYSAFCWHCLSLLPGKPRASPGTRCPGRYGRSKSAAYDQLAQSCAPIGPAGGEVNGENGEALSIPAGALTDSVNVCLSTLTADQLAAQVGPLPQGAQFLGGIVLTAEGHSFALPVTLSIPNNASISSDTQVLVAKTVDTGEMVTG
jgi:hypothetical protein